MSRFIPDTNIWELLSEFRIFSVQPAISLGPDMAGIKGFELKSQLQIAKREARERKAREKVRAPSVSLLQELPMGCRLDTALCRANTVWTKVTSTKCGRLFFFNTNKQTKPARRS